MLKYSTLITDFLVIYLGKEVCRELASNTQGKRAQG